MAKLRKESQPVISFPAPALCQFADQELLLWFGEIISPGFVELPRTENGLRLWLEGDPSDETVAQTAAAKFQTLLGVLRAWRADAGELREERLRGLGEGSVRDQAGNQWIKVGTAVAYVSFGRDDVDQFARQARRGIGDSQNLENALWLNGRPNRTGADYYMIHEYAVREFGGNRGVGAALDVSVNAQERLTTSANNLSPLQGGRHARAARIAPLDLNGQRRFTSELLQRWIRHQGQHGR